MLLTSATAAAEAAAAACDAGVASTLLHGARGHGGIAQDLKADQHALLNKRCVLMIVVWFARRRCMTRACSERQQHMRDDVDARCDAFMAAAAVGG